jgi:hypothetical protein
LPPGEGDIVAKIIDIPGVKRKEPKGIARIDEAMSREFRSGRGIPRTFKIVYALRP